MYYPKSKIITNLYTNGNEYVIKSNGKPYIGFYHKLYNGNIFTGKNPEDSYIAELMISNYSTTEAKGGRYITINNNSEQVLTQDVLIYDVLKDIDSSGMKNIPIPHYPQPTQDEYKLGEFQRYFVKKVNELIYLEIDEETFTNIKNKDSKYAYEYYIPFDFSWQIYGNRIDILKTNRNTVLLAEQNLKIKGLQEFLKNNYDKFYKYPVVNNLNTIGGELQYANSNEYKGLYHIEADRGFVAGNKPSSTNIQPTLFAINLDVEKKLLDNALKAIGEFTYPTPIYDVIRKK
jgi:hypothetical protein